MSEAPHPPGDPPAPWTSPRRSLAVAVVIITLAALLAYANSFRVPFLFDDDVAVTGNDSIKDLGNLAGILTPTGVTIGGRPVVNLTLALNYAWTGTNPWSYHVVNLAIHLLAALALCGVLRRTFARLDPAGPLAAAALPLSALIALLWTVHPLQTASVTYVSQRAEALMALFYLLTLYGFIRSTALSGSARWLWLSVLCCFAGMATKEVMVTAPALVLLYDRVFVAPSFRQALASRRWYYLALASSWLLLACLMTSSRLGDRSVGFRWGVSALGYAMTEFKVVVLYLKLALWPSPLVFDYGREMLVREPLTVLPYAAVVLALLAGTVLLFARGQRALGFLAAAFFILLSPTSSFVPVADQPMAESRMYLPLAAVITAVVLGLHHFFGRRAWYALAVLALQLAALTAARNHDYRSPVAIWGDSVAKHPENSRGQYNFANELAAFPERKTERIAHYEEALRLRPNYPAVHNNLANTLATIPGRLPEAIAHCEEAIRLQPDLASAHNNLANYLARTPGRLPEALSHYHEAIRLKPDYVVAHLNLAYELAKIPGSGPEAVTHFELALQYQPDNAEAHYALATELAKLPGRLPDALAHLEQTVRLQPGNAPAQFDYAGLLARQPGRLPEAVSHYEAFLRLQPNRADAHYNLANKLVLLPGRAPEAIAHYEQALRLNPNFAEAHNNLAIELAKNPARILEAIAHYERALGVKPDFADAHFNLAVAQARIPSLASDALVHFEIFLRLQPDFPDGHYSYAQLLAREPARMLEAIDQYEATLRLRPDHAKAHLGIALALAAIGRREEAVTHLEQALRINPADAGARAALGRLRAGQLP